MVGPPPSDQYIQVGPITTRFWAAGSTGTIVILIHGLGSYVEDWGPNIGSLAEKHRVYAVDLVGCGRSDKPAAPYSLPYLARFVGGFMAAQRIDRASVVGHSMGGGVALQFVSQFPERVEKLVLVNSGGLGREVGLHLRLCSLPLAGEWLTRPRRSGIARYLRKCMADPTVLTDEFVDVCYRLITLPGAQQALLAMTRALIDFRGWRKGVFQPILDSLPRIVVPTMVVWGRQDPITPVAHAYVAAKGIPQARLHVLDRCGHFAQLEWPAEFNTLVGAFLNG